MSEYTGTWTSTKYTNRSVYGKVYTKLSEDKTTGIFMLVYKGSYRYHDQSVINVTLRMNGLVPTNLMVATGTQICYSLRGHPYQQQIEFFADIFTDQIISGKYITTEPDDEGVFNLNKSDCNVTFEEKRNGSNCVIL